MIYPKPLFRKGGPYKGGYSVIGARDEAHEKRLIAAGWHEDKSVAMGHAKPIDGPPTREELEQKAKELGVPFNARTKDEILSDRIAEALDDDEA